MKGIVIEQCGKLGVGNGGGTKSGGTKLSLLLKKRYQLFMLVISIRILNHSGETEDSGLRGLMPTIRSHFYPVHFARKFISVLEIPCLASFFLGWIITGCSQVDYNMIRIISP